MSTWFLVKETVHYMISEDDNTTVDRISEDDNTTVDSI